MSNPIRWPDKSPPVRPSFSVIDDTIIGRFAWHDGVMWIWTDVRRRTYICSAGVEHKTYWRTHWRQGRQDWVACQEHEVI